MYFFPLYWYRVESFSGVVSATLVESYTSLVRVEFPVCEGRYLLGSLLEQLFKLLQNSNYLFILTSQFRGINLFHSQIKIHNPVRKDVSPRVKNFSLTCSTDTVAIIKAYVCLCLWITKWSICKRLDSNFNYCFCQSFGLKRRKGWSRKLKLWKKK